MAAVTTWPLAANKNVVWTPGFIIQQMSDDWISYYTERFHMCVFNVVPRHPDHLVQLHDHLPSPACTEKVQHYFLVCALACPASGSRI